MCIVCDLISGKVEPEPEINIEHLELCVHHLLLFDEGSIQLKMRHNKITDKRYLVKCIVKGDQILFDMHTYESDKQKTLHTLYHCRYCLGDTGDKGCHICKGTGFEPKDYKEPKYTHWDD